MHLEGFLFIDHLEAISVTLSSRRSQSSISTAVPIYSFHHVHLYPTTTPFSFIDFFFPTSAFHWSQVPIHGNRLTTLSLAFLPSLLRDTLSEWPVPACTSCFLGLQFAFLPLLFFGPEQLNHNAACSLQLGPELGPSI